ncbi:B12-binding domain-containing radical SAM protein [Patescibacteria group bacterium]
MKQRLLFIQFTISAEPESAERQHLIEQRLDYCSVEPGVMWVAEVLASKADVKVLNGDLMSDAEVIREVEDYLPQCIGFSSFTAGWPRTTRIADSIRRQHSNLPFVFGGWHVTMCGEAFHASILERYPGSVIVTGRGEGAGDVLLSPHNYAESVIDGNAISALPRRYPFHVPIEPATEPHLSFIGVPHGRMASMLFRGGCTFSCAYCPSGTGLAPDRSVDGIVDEIRKLVLERGAQFIYVRDENPLLYPGLLSDLCRRLIKEGLYKKVGFHSCADVRIVTPDLIELMVEAGWTSVNVGVEHSTESGLRAIGRSQRWETTRQAFEMMRQKGMLVIANLMLWCPNDTMETFDELLKAMLELRPDGLVPAFFTPFPGFSDSFFNGPWRTDDLAEYHFLRPILVNDPSVSDAQLIAARRQLICGYYSSTVFADLMQFRYQQLGAERFRQLTECRRERFQKYGFDLGQVG